ncbi:MAG: hypothetical protein AAF414_17225 [Pseudomonadota bacterium]
MSGARIAVEARLASALDRRDEAPNIELAEELAQTQDMAAIADLAQILATGKQAAKSDAIKVLYEIGERDPSLIAGHTDAFLCLAVGGNNRLVWGALTALACICRVAPELIADNLDTILTAADKGSVIAKDQAMVVLVLLLADERHSASVAPVLLDRLAASAINQLPMYAERAAPVIPTGEKSTFRKILEARLKDELPASKRKRLEKVMKRL